MGRIRSGGKTGRVSMDPATGCFHVLSISSILLRVPLSTTVYASMKVLKIFRPRYRVYGVPTFLTMESSTYKAANFLLGAV